MRIDELQVSLRDGEPPSRAWRLATSALSVVVAERGAHLLDVQVPDADGWLRVSVDFPPGSQGYHGSSVGRWANRVAGAAFELDGERHVLVANEGPNQLHGGGAGFDRRLWTGGIVDGAIELTMTSPDGDQGYPGDVHAVARFELAANALMVTYEATTTARTPVNITSHGYWNLAGGGPLDGHELVVCAARVVLTDDQKIPVAGPPAMVEGTRFDCRSARGLDEVVANGGYDHWFELDDHANPQVELRHESGRSLTVTSDQPGVQIYTGQHLDPADRGVAIETQLPPDGPNRPDLTKHAIIGVDDRYRSRTQLVFNTA